MALKPLVVLCVLVAASFSFLLGYDIGIMSGAKRLVARDLKLDSVEVEVLVGILNIVSAFGGLASGRLADAAGRRCTVGLACAVCIVGSLLMAVATSYSALLVGRVITGFGIGSSFQVSPLYIAEVAPKSLRGRLVTMFDLFINVGILAGYVVGYVVGSQLGLADGPAWRLMLGLGAVPPLLILLALPVMPESPRYLVASGQHERAWGVLQRLYAPHEARATMSLLRDEGGGALPSTWQGLRQIFCPAPGVTRSLLLAGLGAACLQQATGVEAAVYYTPETLEAVGITEERSLLLATVGVGAIKVAFIGVAACLVDRFGRVPLLLASNVGIAFSQALLALSFVLGGSAGGSVGLAVVGQCLFMASFSIGSGPCSMMVASECFPLQVRGLAMGVATLLNRLISGAIALSFLSLTRALTPTGTFASFAVIALLACAFIRRFIPETKGRALEEVEQEMLERLKIAPGPSSGANSGAAVELAASSRCV